MRKKLLLTIFSFLIFFINVINVFTESTLTGMTGISLDAARRYYTVDEIKAYIDVIASNNSNSFFQFHLTDNENIGIECTLFDQTVDNATKNEDGSYTNNKTGKKFLSHKQVQEIMEYAKSKNVDFMPEIDIPAHMQGFFNLAKNKYGNSI